MKESPIFIHSLFRTGSTYIWHKFRLNPKYHCYYEPFHQVLTGIDLENLEMALTHDYELVNHPPIQQYYLHEYRELLEAGKVGLPHFKKSFSFDEFCENGKNPDLKEYIDSLITGAGTKTPLFQFNRSALRIKWFKINYPEGLHIYLVRNPRDQWASYTNLYRKTQDNSFFTMDLMIASLNRKEAPFRKLAHSLPLVEFRTQKFEKEQTFYGMLGDVYSQEDRYLIHYYTWLLALIENVLNADVILNINHLSQDSSYRREVLEAIFAHTKADINFEDCRIKEYDLYPFQDREMDAIEDRALRLVARSVTKKRIRQFFLNLSSYDRHYFRVTSQKFEEISGILPRLFESRRELGRWRCETKTDLSAKKREIKKTAAAMVKRERDAKKNLNGRIHRIIFFAAFPYRLLKKLKARLSGKYIPAKNESALTLSLELFRLRIKSKLRSSHESIARRAVRKINLSDSLTAFYGRHRSGLLYAVQSLMPLHTNKGTYFDAFIERTFHWNPKGVKPHLKPWIGIIHIPPNIPEWFQSEQSNVKIFTTPAWQESLPFCRGLFTLSAYHKKSLVEKLDVPINTLLLPTETPGTKWTKQKFEANQDKKIVQIGWWLRKLHTIFQLDVKSYRKIFIKITYANVDELMAIERGMIEQEGAFSKKMYETVETWDFLPDNTYDQLMSENIVIANLYDSSANNLIIECIVRNTPILVNPLEPVREYLGDDYPLYFDSLEEAARLAEDVDQILRAHEYLLDHPIKAKLTGDYFFQSFIDSEIYQNL